MAATYSPFQAFEYAKKFIKSMPLQDVQTRILDDTNKMIWQAAPWRWSIGTLTAITLASNTQDYTLVPPEDFNYLLHSYISDGSGVVNHLAPVPSLPPLLKIYGKPTLISYQGSNTFRISPNPGTINAAPTSQILSWYKKIPPIITPAEVGTAGVLVMDDSWFWVYEAGVLYFAYLYGDDQRAGSASYDAQGKFQFTGQRAAFEAAIEQMKAREPMPFFENRLAADVRDTK